MTFFESASARFWKVLLHKIYRKALWLRVVSRLTRRSRERNEYLPEVRESGENVNKWFEFILQYKMSRQVTA